jgi:hypothetical protein
VTADPYLVECAGRSGRIVWRTARGIGQRGLDENRLIDDERAVVYEGFDVASRLPSFQPTANGCALIAASADATAITPTHQIHGAAENTGRAFQQGA